MKLSKEYEAWQDEKINEIKNNVNDIICDLEAVRIFLKNESTSKELRLNFADRMIDSIIEEEYHSYDRLGISPEKYEKEDQAKEEEAE